MSPIPSGDRALEGIERPGMRLGRPRQQVVGDVALLLGLLVRISREAVAPLEPVRVVVQGQGQ